MSIFSYGCGLSWPENLLGVKGLQHQQPIDYSFQQQSSVQQPTHSHTCRHAFQKSLNPRLKQVPSLFNIFLSLYTHLEKHHLPAAFSWEFLTSAQFSHIIWRWSYLLVLCFSKSLPTACHLSSTPHTQLYKGWLVRKADNSPVAVVSRKDNMGNKSLRIIEQNSAG